MLSKKYRLFLDSVAHSVPDIDPIGFSYNRLCQITQLSIENLIPIVHYLHFHGYIGLVNNPPDGIWLLERGKKYRSFAVREIMKFILTHIIIPSGVSIITCVCMH